MQGAIRSIITGAASGIATCAASIYALSYTNAFVMPSWASFALWEAVVVFGVGATLVALLIHFAALRAFQAKGPGAFMAFLGAALLTLMATGQLSFGVKALVAWAVGAILASLAYGKLRREESFKANPHRLA